MNRQKDLYHFRNKTKIKSRGYTSYKDDETGIIIKYKKSNLHHYFWDDINNGVNYNALRHYIKSRVGESWDRIFSDVMVKVKTKHHHIVKKIIKYYVVDEGYDQDFYPIAPFSGRIFENRLYVDYFGKLQYYSEEKVDNFSRIQCRNKRREEKLKRILNKHMGNMGKKNEI